LFSRKFLAFILAILSFQSIAQTYKHSSFWSRLAIQKSIKKLDLRVEMDFRQQNDFQKSALNPFQKPALRWIRLNTTYNTGKFAHTIIWPNPIKTYPLVGSKTDLLRPSQKEWRTTLNEEFTHKYKKLSVALRLGYEIRRVTVQDIKRNEDRIRLRLGEFLKITPKTTINSSFEYLWNAKPNVANNPFNQSQLAFRLIHKFNKNLDFTTGVNHVFRQRSNSEVYDIENALLCNILISLW
jgi:hypothetical protein